MVDATITSHDHRVRIIAFADKEEAKAEVMAYRKDGLKAHIVVRKGVYNVVVS